MEKTLFEKIADRELPAEIIWEDDKFCAFLSIGPIKKGHTLVVPKKNPGDYLFAMDDANYLALMQAAKTVAKLLKDRLNCARVLVLVEGFEVPHVHVHLIPAKPDDGIHKGSISMASADELALVAKEIRNQE